MDLFHYEMALASSLSLIGVVHHGDEEVEEDDDVDEGVAAEHEEAEEPSELLRGTIQWKNGNVNRLINVFNEFFLALHRTKKPDLGQKTRVMKRPHVSSS